MSINDGAAYLNAARCRAGLRAAMIGDIMKGARPCIVTICSEEHNGLLLDIGFRMWTHGSGITIGSFSAGQESHPCAIVELENGEIRACDLDCLRMLDSAGLFKEYCFHDSNGGA